MTRISLGLVTLLALSSAVSIVSAHEGHDHAQQKFNIPGDDDYSASAPDLQEFKVITCKPTRLYFLSEYRDSTMMIAGVHN